MNVELPVEKQKEILRTISNEVLFEEAKERKAKLEQRLGKYATMKRVYRCKGCGKLWTARKLRSHDCPSGLGWKRRYPEAESKEEKAA